MLPGTTLSEKLAWIGVERRGIIEIRHLDKIGRDYGIVVYLFLEKDLATTDTLAQVENSFVMFLSTSAPMLELTVSLN